MPSFLTYRGVRYYQPTTVVDVNNDLVQTEPLGARSLMVVGDFPQLEQNKVHTFRTDSGAAIEDVYPDVRKLIDYKKFWYKSLAGQEGGAIALSFVNAGSNTQASLNMASALVGQDLDNDGANDGTNLADAATAAVILKANYWGTDGNRVQVRLEDANTLNTEMDTDQHFYRLIIKSNGDPIVRDFGAYNQLRIQFTEAAANDFYSFRVSESGNFIYSGIYNGSSVSDVSVALSEFETMSALATYVSSIPGCTGFADNQLEEIAPEKLDVKAFNIEDGEEIKFSAHTWDMERDITASSTLPISFTLGTNGYRILTGAVDDAQAANPAFSNMTGGTQSVATSSDYATTLPLLDQKLHTSMVVESTAATVHKEVAKHLQRSEDTGKERNAYLPATAGLTLDVLKDTYISPLNIAGDMASRISIISQECKYVDSKGITRDGSTAFLAFVMMCMQGALSPAESATRKLPDILGVTQDWDAADQKAINKACRYSLMVIGVDSNSNFRVERALTAYQRDNRLELIEVSIRESVDMCVRELRRTLDRAIGSTINGSTKSRIELLCNKRLKEIANAGIISSFANVKLTVGDDRVDISFDLKPTSVVNFISVVANIIR